MPVVNKQVAHGVAQEKRIIEAIRDTALTAEQIAKVLGCQRANIGKYLVRMRRQGIRPAYIAGYVERPSQRPAPKYRAGTKPDVLFTPKVVRNKNPLGRTERRLGQIRAILKDGPCSVKQIAERMPMSLTKAREYVCLMRETGEAHIKEWRRPGCAGGSTAFYVLGDGADARQPLETRAERYARLKAEAKAKADEARRARRELESKRLVFKQNTWLSALGL